MGPPPKGVDLDMRINTILEESERIKKILRETFVEYKRVAIDSINRDSHMHNAESDSITQSNVNAVVEDFEKSN